MRKRTLALAAVAALAVGIACTPLPPGPTTIEITNTNTNTQGGGPQASPSPSASPGSSEISRVAIGGFGQRCPAGTQPSGDGRDGTVRVGCTIFLTISAYGPTGLEHFDLAVIGVQPDSFAAVNGEGTLVQTTVPSNPFNRDALGRVAGTVEYRGCIKGVCSPPYTLRIVS